VEDKQIAIINMAGFILSRNRQANVLKKMFHHMWLYPSRYVVVISNFRPSFPTYPQIKGTQSKDPNSRKCELG
jgi:hypothetical protein